jgi:hypothetical protein
VDFDFSDEQIILRDSVRKMMDRIATPDYAAGRTATRSIPMRSMPRRLPFAEEYSGLGCARHGRARRRDGAHFFTAWGGIANAAQRHRGFDRFEGEMTA